MNCLTYIRVRGAACEIPAKFRIQDEAIRQHLRRHGWTCLQSFVDIMPEGTNERPSRTRLLDRCQRGSPRVDAVLIHSRDRLIRNLAGYFRIAQTLQQQGIRLIVVAETSGTFDTVNRFCH